MNFITVAAFVTALVYGTHAQTTMGPSVTRGSNPGVTAQRRPSNPFMNPYMYMMPDLLGDRAMRMAMYGAIANPGTTGTSAANNMLMNPLFMGAAGDNMRELAMMNYMTSQGTRPANTGTGSGAGAGTNPGTTGTSATNNMFMNPLFMGVAGDNMRELAMMNYMTSQSTRPGNTGTGSGAGAGTNPGTTGTSAGNNMPMNPLMLWGMGDAVRDMAMTSMAMNAMSGGGGPAAGMGSGMFGGPSSMMMTMPFLAGSMF